MAYVATNWVDYPNVSTAITAAQLNRIEAGVVAVSDIVLNAKTFGVKFDGVTDDTAAWQAAITATQLVSGKLVAPKGAGTSIISTPLTVTAACELDLGSVTLKKKATFLTSSDGALVVSGPNVTVRNVVGDGNRAAGVGGWGIEWTGANGHLFDSDFSHSTVGVYVHGATANLTCVRVTASDNVISFGTSGDGFFVTAGGVLTTYSCVANANGRSGFEFDSTAGDLCRLDGLARLNGLNGARVLNHRGQCGTLLAEDNQWYGLAVGSNSLSGVQERWSFDYVEANFQGLTAANPIANGVQLFSAIENVFDALVAKANPGYGLAIGGGNNVGSKRNSIGSVHLDAANAVAGGPNPGIVFVGGSTSGTTHNTIGEASVRGHTVAVNFGEGVTPNTDDNSIDYLYAKDCAYGVAWIGTGSRNRIGKIVARDCYTSDATKPGLIAFLNTTASNDNVVESIDARTASGTKPLNIVFFQAGTARNAVREIDVPGGDYQTAIVSDAGTDSRYPAVIRSPLKPAAAQVESFERGSAGTDAAALVTATMTMVAVYLPQGFKVTSISFLAGGTALGTGVNQWFALYDRSRAKLAVTSDDTSTAWAASNLKTLALSAPYTTTYEGVHYLACMVKATTVPTLVSRAVLAAVTQLAPILAGTSTAALTNPASAPATAAAITAFAAQPYCYVA